MHKRESVSACQELETRLRKFTIVAFTYRILTGSCCTTESSAQLAPLDIQQCFTAEGTCQKQERECKLVHSNDRMSLLLLQFLSNISLEMCTCRTDEERIFWG